MSNIPWVLGSACTSQGTCECAVHNATDRARRETDGVEKRAGKCASSDGFTMRMERRKDGGRVGKWAMWEEARQAAVAPKRMVAVPLTPA